MSTEFYPIPRIEYDKFVKECKGIEFTDPSEPKYVCPHKLMTLGDNKIWCFNWDTWCFNWDTIKNCPGNDVWFERFGQNSVAEMFELIEKQFDVRIFDERELWWRVSEKPLSNSKPLEIEPGLLYGKDTHSSEGD